MTTDTVPITIFGDHDRKTLDQIHRCADPEQGAVAAALCADGHLGYSCPIGGVVAYRDHVSVSGVGYDIGCGNKAALTNLTLKDVSGDLSAIADEIAARVSFGMGRKNKEPVDHPVLDRIRDANFDGQRELYDKAAEQLGTVGAGNHYVDVFADERDRIWVGVHFGSRGFGHTTASGFLALAQGAPFSARERKAGGIKVSGGGMEARATVLDTRTELGQSYLAAAGLAQDYAYAGRDLVVRKIVKDILQADTLDEVHNHHNAWWAEEHAGETLVVVRKGATPAFPGQRGFVGSTMGEPSVILEGVDTPDSERALFSTVHGAGRAMSRNEAAGKVKTMRVCSDRDCTFAVTKGEYRVAREAAGVGEHDRFTVCPTHPDGRMHNRPVRVADGKIDFETVREDLAATGIELRGGAADEAPAAYKRLPDVLAHHEGTVRILHTLTPLIVVMAGPDTADPYKD